MNAHDCREICATNGLQLDDTQERLLSTFADSVLAWNKKLNLLSRRDEEYIWERHILHSIALLFHVDIPKRARIADVGTGGGFPGVPLKICRPDVTMTLIDSAQKKIAALDAIAVNLLGVSPSMEGIATAAGRVEELARTKEFHGLFDFVVARAVASLDDLLRWSKGLLKPRGTILALKGGDVEPEVQLAKKRKYVRVITIKDLYVEDFPDFTRDEKKIVMVELAAA